MAVCPVEAISKAVNSEVANVAAAAIHKAAEPLKLIRENFQRAAERCLQLPPPERHAIIQQLIAVAKAQLAVADEEKKTLQQICIALQVNPAFPEKVFSQYEVDYVFAHMQ